MRALSPRLEAMPKTIAITTPTGNVGSKLAGHLADRARRDELELILLARKPEAVKQWIGPGVRVCAGRIEDADFLVGATHGVDALYWATPNSFAPALSLRAGYRMFAESAAAAIEANRIPHVVHLSGFAHVDDGGGERSLFGALAESEAILADAIENLRARHPDQSYGITHLRAGYFFENLLGQLYYMREHGRLFLPVNRGRRIPMVASHDVALKAMSCLLGAAPSGRVFQGAFGPQDLSFAEVASSLSAGVGRKIRVHRLPSALIRHQLLKMGRDHRTTDAFILAFQAISQGKVAAEPTRDRSSTTEMSLKQWATIALKPLIESNEAAACPARVQYEAS